MNYIVIFTYSFDDEVSVYGFETEDSARQFLRKSYEEELRIDIDENGWNSSGWISDDEWRAKIINRFQDYDDITEFRIHRIDRINSVKR